MSEEKFISPMMPTQKPTIPPKAMPPVTPPKTAPTIPTPTPPAVTMPMPPMQMPAMPQMPQMPPMPPMPQMPVMPPVTMPTMISPCDLLMMVKPVVKHGCRELPKCGPKHTLTEVAMIAFLMGTGLDYRTALMLVESWEVHDTFFREEG